MKKLLSFIISLIVFISLIWFVDGWFVNLVVNAFPPSAADWLTLIRVVTWIVVLWATFGIAIFISSIVWMVVTILFHLKSKNVEQDIKFTIGKSKWQERLEEIQARQSKKR